MGTVFAGLQGSILVDRPSQATVGERTRRAVVTMAQHLEESLQTLVSRVDRSVEKAIVVFDEANRSRSEDLSYLHRWVARR